MLGIMPNSMFFVKGFFDETRVPKTDVPGVITYDINTTFVPEVMIILLAK